MVLPQQTRTQLQTQASDGAAAQLKLARTETALNALGIAPFRASPKTGGSPQLARGLMDRVRARSTRRSPT